MRRGEVRSRKWQKGGETDRGKENGKRGEDAGGKGEGKGTWPPVVRSSSWDQKGRMLGFTHGRLSEELKGSI